MNMTHLSHLAHLGTPQRQQGVALVFAMIFLILIAMLAVTVGNVNSLEERMSGNTRDRDLAFQAAEAGLRDAEYRLHNNISNFRSTIFPTYNAATANDQAYWSSYDWSTAYTVTQTLAQVGTQPKFVVERMPDVGTTQNYRVTARGTGGSSEAVVILQAQFAYTPPGP